MLTFEHVIIREPGSSFSKCISFHPLRRSIDLSNAQAQHSRYCNVISKLGVELIHIPRNDSLPDSCFVEDTAIIHNNKAFIARLGVESRRGEELAIESVLKEYMDTKRAMAPATIEGGDVIHLPNRLISGLSQRTNIAGIDQMKEWLNVEVDTIDDSSIVHLKSHVTYLGNDTVISTKAYINHPVLKDFKILVVPTEESYAANSLTINGTVLIPTGCPKTESMVREAGFDVLMLDMSEFEKCQGALTCLSILF